MNFYIVIPAHNEEEYIQKTLLSLANQTFLPKKIVVVDDHSTDKTSEIVDAFCKQHAFISLVKNTSSDEHLPGSKVVNAFYKGLETLDENYDVICKFDADLIFPENYLETIAKIFKNNPKCGMASGLLYIEKNNDWVYETISDKTHIRGPIKSYTKSCFQAIGGLKMSIGWDTVDVLLAQYHKYKTITDHQLHVKHLKPTGKIYSKKARFEQGKALYLMRYGWHLSTITAIKMALNKRSSSLFFDYLKGYVQAKKNNLPFLVSIDEGKFIRQLRWRRIKEKLF